MPILYKLFQEMKRKEYFPTHNLGSGKTNYKQGKLQTNIHCKHMCKSYTQNLASEIQLYTKRIIHNDQVWFIPGIKDWFNILKLAHLIYYINKEETPCNHISRCRNKNPTPSPDKNSQQTKNNMELPQTDKGNLWKIYS